MDVENFKTKFIVNPRSANGSTGRKWETLRGVISAEFGAVDASFTTSSNHAAKLAREALSDGFEMVVAVGGDGTVNEVVNGFFESGSPFNPDAVLGVISRGTGSDFIKTMNIPKELEAAAKTLRGRAVRRCDTGRITSRGPNGEQFERHFINIADFGVGGEAVERVNNTSKALGGFLSFLYSTLKTLLQYKGKNVTIRIDDDIVIEKKINSVVIANGQYFGGGMWISPKAKIDDGLFDILILDDASVIESLLNVPKIYKGTHIDSPKATCLRGMKVVAESDEDVLIDVEGEYGGLLPASFEIIPSSINIKIGD